MPRGESERTKPRSSIRLRQKRSRFLHRSSEFCNRTRSAAESLSPRSSSTAAMTLLAGRLAENDRAGFHVKPAQDIAEDLTGSIVIAGVGGLLIWKILQALQERGTLKARRLILGPHRDETWLADRLRLGALPSWNLTKEGHVLERGRSRRLLVVEKF